MECNFKKLTGPGQRIVTKTVQKNQAGVYWGSGLWGQGMVGSRGL